MLLLLLLLLLLAWHVKQISCRTRSHTQLTSCAMFVAERLKQRNSTLIQEMQQLSICGCVCAMKGLFQCLPQDVLCVNLPQPLTEESSWTCLSGVFM